MSDHNDSGDFFKGFLLGGIVGAIASLLYAPKSGKEMRGELRQRSLELKGDAEARLETAQKRLENLFDDARKQLDGLRKEADDAVQEARDTATKKFEEGKSRVASEKGRVKEAIDAGVSAYKEEKQSAKKKS